jgi:hypothetical protein
MIPVRFDTPMRTTPSVTLYNPAAANAQIRDENHAADCSGATVLGLAAEGFFLALTGNAATTVASVLGIHYIADADL